MRSEQFTYSSVEEAIQAIADGRMVIIADDEDRENEGDLVCAAEKVTPELINFMATEGRGLICLTLTPEHCEKLQLPLMTQRGNDVLGTAFTISVDAHSKFGVTTGISTSDRAKTIQVAIAPDATATDLRRPGHIFPLMSKPGGVLQRVGQTEASVDIAKLAGLQPAGVICEILNADGSMARRNDLQIFAEKHKLPFITVSQLIEFRLRTERSVIEVVSVDLPTEYGHFQIKMFENVMDGSEHLALVKGDIAVTSQTPVEQLPWVRMHSQCFTGDLLASLRCDCGHQLHAAMQMIDAHGCGAIVYLQNHEGRGIGLRNKLKAYKLQDQGADTVEANLALGFLPDLRDYGTGAQILLTLGITRFKLLTNNPRKVRGLDGYGLQIEDRVPIIHSNKYNEDYLKTKRDKLGHIITDITETLPTEGS